MNTTIKYFVILITMLITTLASGQERARPSAEEKAKREALGLQRQLSLSDAQAAQCEQIIKKYAEQLLKTHKNKNDSAKMNTEQEQLVRKRDMDIKAVLTSGQKIKFDTWKKKKQHHNGKAIETAKGDNQKK